MALLSKKPLSDLLAEAESGTLRRSLGAFSLTTLGIGAVIGAGIFVITGTAAAQFAGPALVISMLIAGVGCAFAGLCYAEFASMIPVAGSAYTYAYATLGEIFAWIIGWDLILEYALGASTIAVGWAGNVQSFLQDFGLGIPAQWAGPPLTTIRVPLVEMAQQAVRLVMRLREEPELAFTRIEMETSLVVRESTAPPRQRTKARAR